MRLNDTPIRQKILRAIMITSGAVLLLTCAFYFAYDIYTFRQSMVRQLSTLGQIIAANSTAALAFDSRPDAEEVLSALKAETHIKAACLYDQNDSLFALYPETAKATDFPPQPEKNSGYQFGNLYLTGFQPVSQGEKRLGTLYIRSDMTAIYDRLKLYAGIAIVIVALSFALAYLLAKRLHHSISRPVLALSETAQVISRRQDYSVRATKLGDDELGMLTDTFNQMLSEIEQKNNEIQTFNHTLEQNIIKRTEELESANKELESFSYSVSHDLRAPLRSINGYSRILLEDYSEKLDDEGRRLLEVITRNGLRMGQLIDDLLSFSRIGKQNLVKVNLNMESIARHVVEELNSQRDQKSEVVINPILSAEGDSSMIKQVFTNLVSNAFKYSNKKEKARIELGSWSEKDANVYYVKDNGAGFSMDYYDKLFGVFQRLHSASEFEGTGVGLALVNRIITKHGGKVWAEGKVNEGATFYFSLPVKH
jgi:signal transduction histidine kinase